MTTAFTVFNHPEFLEYYQFRSAAGEILTGKMNIVFMELTKLKTAMERSVDQMNPAERWAIFIQFVNIKSERELVSEIL